MDRKRILIFMAGLLAIGTIVIGAAACSDDDDDDGDDDGGSTEITVGDLTITEPFSRMTMDRGAVFFVVKNEGTEDDAIVSASTDAADTVELHETVTEGASTKMQQVPQIDVAAGEETTLEPGGLHVMMMDLTSEMAMGDTFEVEIEFENAGKVAFEVQVTDYAEETMPAEEGGM
jgi:copper(I)-binding protein